MATPTTEIKYTIYKIKKDGGDVWGLCDITKEGKEVAGVSSGSLKKLSNLGVIIKNRNDKLWRPGKFYKTFCDLVERVG